MKKAIILTMILVCMSFSANAQKRKKTVSKTANPPVAANEIRDGAEKVSIQLKNVSKFVYLLGGIARGIEDIEKDARNGNVSRATLDKNQTYKQNVIASIQGLRAGLIQLEADFRVKPKLKLYLQSIQGITEISGTAEDQATRGEMVNAGKTLLQIIEKLSDTLVALP